MCTYNRCHHIDIFHFISRVNQDIQDSNTYTMLDLATRPHKHLEILCLCLASLQWVIQQLNQVTLILQVTHSQVTLRLIHQQVTLSQAQGTLNLPQGTLNLAQGTPNLAQGTHQQGILSPLVLKGIHNQILLKVILNLLKQGTLSQGTHSKVKGTRSLTKGTHSLAKGIRLLTSTRGTVQIANKPKARHTMYLRDIFPQLRYVIKSY